jgi:hypothetical protein
MMEEFDEEESEEDQYDDSRYVRNRDYDTYLDIINAYKTLK